MAYDGSLTSALLGLFARTVFASLRRRAGLLGRRRQAQCGAVSFVQRFGDALNLNVHFHSLVLDDVYARDSRVQRRTDRRARARVKAVSPGILVEVQGVRLFQEASTLKTADSGTTHDSYIRAYWPKSVGIRSL
jgi:hypothetical protein